MKFEIHFDKDIYNKQMDLLFELAYKRKIDYYKNAQYLGVILIIIGVFVICKRPNIFGIGYVFIFFGLSNLIPFVYYYFKIKAYYKKIQDVKIKENEASSYITNINLEFTEDYLQETVNDHVNIINWTEIIQYIIRENNLILIAKNYQLHILGEDEVGKEDFQKIISFIKTKFETRE